MTDRLCCPNPKIPSTALSVFVNCPVTVELHLFQANPSTITRSISKEKTKERISCPVSQVLGFSGKQVPNGKWITQRQRRQKKSLLYFQNTACPRHNILLMCFRLHTGMSSHRGCLKLNMSHQRIVFPGCTFHLSTRSPRQMMSSWD